MTKFKTVASLIVAAMVAAPAISMAQDNDRDSHDRDHDRMEHRVDDRGAGHQHWHRGDRVSDDYRGSRYEVRDWRGHHLSEPPRGYHWVQVDGDFVLAAVATGVIADVLLNK
jgi:Ni/Co efflux regulator RcnB